MVQRSPFTCLTGATGVAPAIPLLLAACILAAGCSGTLLIPDPGGIFVPGAGTGAGDLRVYFLDVGQGDATVLCSGSTTILVDAGEIGDGDRVVADLRSLGVSRIDLLVATHPHSDHIGGMEAVLAAFPVGRVLDAGMPHPSPAYERFLETVARNGIPYQVAERGQTLDPGPSLRILVLSPPGERAGDDLNENSVVLRVSHGTVDFLLCGDAGTGTEDALLTAGYALDAEILRIGHHGSSDSTGAAFLSRVHPGIAVISAGRDNPYGHPHAPTLAALEEAGIAVYRTDRDGTILVTSSGASYAVSTETGSGAPLIPAPSGTIVPQASLNIPVFPAGATPRIVIGEVQFDAPGDDRLNLNGEWVRIANRGGEAVLLAGWTLSDRTDDSLYVFPPFILEPGRTVTVYTGAGSFNATALFMGRTGPAWGNGGDVAVLKDPGGRIVDEAF